MGHKTPSVPGVSSYHFWDATMDSLFFWDISHEVACKWWLTLALHGWGVDTDGMTASTGEGVERSSFREGIST